MIEPIGPFFQAPREEVEFGRVQIPGGWIHAQCVPVSGGRNALGRTDRSGIEQQLRKERRTVTGRGGAGDANISTRLLKAKRKMDLSPTVSMIDKFIVTDSQGKRAAGGTERHGMDLPKVAYARDEFLRREFEN